MRASGSKAVCSPGWQRWPGDWSVTAAYSLFTRSAFNPLESRCLTSNAARSSDTFSLLIAVFVVGFQAATASTCSAAAAVARHRSLAGRPSRRVRSTHLRRGALPETWKQHTSHAGPGRPHRHLLSLQSGACGRALAGAAPAPQRGGWVRAAMPRGGGGQARG